RLLPRARPGRPPRLVGRAHVERRGRADADDLPAQPLDRSADPPIRPRARLGTPRALDAASRALRRRAPGAAPGARRAPGDSLRRMSAGGSFTAFELRRLRALKTPRGIQRALDAMPYHAAGTAWSPRRVLREGTAHCLEGAIFAAAAL